MPDRTEREKQLELTVARLRRVLHLAKGVIHREHEMNVRTERLIDNELAVERDEKRAARV